MQEARFSNAGGSLNPLYCNEIQNLVSYDSGLDTILSESRKFGISVVSANQFLDQYPQKMRQQFSPWELTYFSNLRVPIRSKSLPDSTGGDHSPNFLRICPAVMWW